MKKLLVIILSIAAVIGVAIFAGLGDRFVEYRLRSALVEHGVGDVQAECMATRMVERLTTEQILKLRNLEPQEGVTETPMGVRDFLDRVGRIDDREVVTVSLTSAGLCGLGLG